MKFFDGATLLSTVPVSAGAASLTLSTLAPGAHSLTAQYSGDLTYDPTVSAAMSVTIAKLPATILSLLPSINPAAPAQPLTLTAKLSSAAATGTMKFFDGATLLSTVPVSGGAASLTLSTLALGIHSVTAQYSGDLTYDPTVSAAMSVTIAKLPTTIVSQQPSINPAPPAQPLTLKAILSSATATGTVKFFDGVTLLSTVPVSAGTASSRFRPWLWVSTA